jgi:hypothetical protein
MRILKIVSILLSIVLAIGLGLYLLFILPEYLACLNCKYEGDACKTIWGNVAECHGESKDIGEGIFQFITLILIGLSIVTMIIWNIYYKQKSKANKEGKIKRKNDL